MRPREVHPAGVALGTISDLLAVPAFARTSPLGAATKLPPQNSIPWFGPGSTSHPVDRGDVHAVGDGVAPLDRLPGGLLGGAVLRLLRDAASRSPSDRTGSAPRRAR